MTPPGPADNGSCPRLWAAALAVLVLWPALGGDRCRAGAGLRQVSTATSDRTAAVVFALHDEAPVAGLVGGLALLAVGVLLLRPRRGAGSHTVDPGSRSRVTAGS